MDNETAREVGLKKLVEIAKSIAQLVIIRHVFAGGPPPLRYPDDPHFGSTDPSIYCPRCFEYREKCRCSPASSASSSSS